MPSPKTDEYALLLEKAQNLTLEEIAVVEASLARQKKCYRDFVHPRLHRRILGAITFGGWRSAENPERVGRYCLVNDRELLKVIVSGEIYADNRRWIHLSVSHRDREPSWDELKMVKHRFFGDDVRAIQVFPPKEEWVNVHAFCLHLWWCLDDDGLPDFRSKVGEIMSI